MVGAAYTRTEDFNKKESANDFARLLSTDPWHSTKGQVLFMCVINNTARQSLLPFEFDRNMAERFPPGTASTIHVIVMFAIGTKRT